MQRSRRALLQRRAMDKAVSGRSFCYKVSLSLVFVLWGLVFLMSLWISYIDGNRVGFLTWNESQEGHTHADLADSHQPRKTRPLDDYEGSCTEDVESGGSVNVEMRASEGETNHVSDVRKFEVGNTVPGVNSEIRTTNPERLSDAVPVGLDEFKSKAFSSKSKFGTSQTGSVKLRVEPGGKEYNYASLSKGAKVLSFNKEAKDASSILCGDKNKYLRNPCSAEVKFVIIELSEETLVDSISIANFEHYSSNLKDFELSGSLTYPTDVWVDLANFTAANVKQAQRFSLHEPKWVRYLKLNLLSHYGSEFYCTVSLLEVYGVDAVEWMLEDLMSAQDKLFILPEVSDDRVREQISSQTESTQGGSLCQNLPEEIEYDSSLPSSISKHDVKCNVADPVEETRPQQNSRMPGDTVLKLLMQKVRSLDLNLSVLERYLEELNSRYGNIFKEFDVDIAEKDTLLVNIRSDIKKLLNSQNLFAQDVGNLISWKSFVSLQLDILLRDNALLRSQIEKVKENQISLQNKGVIVFIIGISFGSIALVKLFLDTIWSLYLSFSGESREKSRTFCGFSDSWLFMLLSCTIIILILSF